MAVILSASIHFAQRMNTNVIIPYVYMHVNPLWYAVGPFCCIQELYAVYINLIFNDVTAVISQLKFACGLR
jgi:hypothetical protein